MVTGYAVSTQSVFTCPPYSIREKATRLRRTYCAIEDPKSKLLCFTESEAKDSVSQGQISTSSLDLKGTPSPIVYLGGIHRSSGGEEDSSHALIVLHKDGHLRCISQNLLEEYWTSTICPASNQQGTEVKAATLISVAQAQKTLLKNREDLLALVDADLEAKAGSKPAKAVLVVISLESNALYLRLHYACLLTPPTENGVHQSASVPCEEIMSCLIPVPAGIDVANATCSISEGGGALYQNAQHSLVIYNLFSAVPRVESQLDSADKISSCLRLRSSDIIFTSPTSISVLDPKYRSLLDTRSIERITERASNLVMPNASNGTSEFAMQLLSNFSSLETVIGLQGRTLVAIHVTDTNSGMRQLRKRSKSGGLIDAVRRGINLSRTTVHQNIESHPTRFGLGVPARSLKDPNAWLQKKTQLDGYAARVDVEKFDEAMALELDPSFNVFYKADSLSKTSKAVENQDDSEEQNAPKQATKRSSKYGKCDQIDNMKVQYALGKIFGLSAMPNLVKQDEQQSLDITLFPRKTFAWLATNGYISLHQVESALKHSSMLPVTVSLRDTAVIDAISCFDGSLASLDLILRGPALLKPQELVGAIRVVMQTIQRSRNEGDLKLLTNGVEGQDHTIGDDGDIDMANQEPKDLDLTNPESGNLYGFNEIIGTCLRRLYTYHDADIRRSLREVMSVKEMIALIDYLRIQIGQGGWLVRYVDDLRESASTQNPENGQLRIHAKLFNCTIDALGPGGWILDGYELLESGDNIGYMKAEVSAALEGIEEAAYLQGMLSEFLLYTKIAPPTPATPRKVFEPNKPVAVSLEEAQANVLPLGIKGPPRISSTKIGAGGEIKTRTLRDIGKLKSQQVGKYSFERIIL